MDNKLGINLWNWVNDASEKEKDLISRAAEAGYKAVEIGMNKSSLDVSAVKEQKSEYKIEVSLCAFMVQGRDISNFDPEIRKNTKSYITKCLKTAEKTGAIAFSGPLFAGGGKTHLLSVDDKKREWDLAVEGLCEMADVARDCGTLLCIEPLNRYRTSVVNTVSQALAMVKEIDRDNVGILFDTFHAEIEESDTGEALETVLKAGKLFHFHASDSNRGVPGKGHVDWLNIFSVLNEYNYSGHITIETFMPGGLDSGWCDSEFDRDKAASEGLKNIRSFLNKIKDK